MTIPVTVPEARWRATYGAYRGEKDTWRVWGQGGKKDSVGALRREDLERRREKWVREMREREEVERASRRGESDRRRSRI